MWVFLFLVGLLTGIVAAITVIVNAIRKKRPARTALVMFISMVVAAVSAGQMEDPDEAVTATVTPPVIASVAASTVPSPSIAATTTPAPTPAATATPEPSKAPEDKVKAAALKNFDAAKIDLQADGWTEILVLASDNFTTNMIRTSILSGISKTLKELKDIPEVVDVTFKVTFPMVDKFGNQSEQVVVQTTFLKATRDKINWSNFSYSNIPDIADSYGEHASFKK